MDLLVSFRKLGCVSLRGRSVSFVVKGKKAAHQSARRLKRTAASHI